MASEYDWDELKNPLGVLWGQEPIPVDAADKAPSAGQSAGTNRLAHDTTERVK